MGLTSVDIPKDRQENLEWRIWVAERAQIDPEFAAAVYRVFHDDPIFAFNGFFYTYDPRPHTDIHHIPFVLWDFQVDVVHQICYHMSVGKDLLFLKSRDMGLTWVIVATLFWHWKKPESGNDFLLGSRKQDLVDKRGDINSLFHKARYLLNRLPPFLRPYGFDPNKHDSLMRLINPESGNIMSGEANNESFGTGGRYRAALIDEFSKWEHTDDAAWTSLGDTTPCRIVCSTPKGRGNKFADLCLGVDDTDIDIIKLPWQLHPLKDDKWYESERRRRSELELAQEVDLSFEGSAGKRFFNEYNASLHRGDLPILPGKDVLVGLDFGYHHPAVLCTQIDDHDRWLWQRCILGSEVEIDTFIKYVWKRVCDWYPGSNFTWFVDIAGTFRNDKSVKTSVMIVRECVEGPVLYRKVDREDINTRMRELLNQNIAGQPAMQIGLYAPEMDYTLPAFVEREDMDYVHEAFTGGIHYPSKNRNAKEDWDKEGYYEHIIDAAGFIITNKLRKNRTPSRQTAQLEAIQERNRRITQTHNHWQGNYGRAAAAAAHKRGIPSITHRFRGIS
jgi:hypothetical protein